MTDQHATSRPELPADWATDPYWSAAVHLLDSFGDDGRVWAHVTPEGIDYPAILDEGWSGGQRRILRAAASLWNDETPVSVLDILAGVGDAHWQRFIEAAQILRDGLR